MEKFDGAMSSKPRGEDTELQQVEQVELYTDEKIGESYKRELESMLEPALKKRLIKDYEFKRLSTNISNLQHGELEEIVLNLRLKFMAEEKLKENSTKKAKNIRDFMYDIVETVGSKLEEGALDVDLDSEVAASITLNHDQIDRYARNQGRIAEEYHLNYYHHPDLEVDDLQNLNKYMYGKNPLMPGPSNFPNYQHISDLRHNLKKYLVEFEEATYFIQKSTIVPVIAAPKSEYSDTLSRRLAETSTKIALAAKEINNLNEAAAKNSTYSEMMTEVVRDSATGLLEENAYTISQSLILLTAQKIDGYVYESDDKLIEDIIGSNLVEQFARILSYSGIVGPMVICGLYFKDLVKYSADKGLFINSEYIKVFHENRIETRGQEVNHNIRSTVKNGRDIQEIFSMLEDRGQLDPSIGSLLTGCPAAMKSETGKSSLGIMNEIFLGIFKQTTEDTLLPIA